MSTASDDLHTSWWKRLRDLWPGALRQRVTRTGLTFSLIIIVLALASVLSANNLLFLILAAMLAILAVSGFVSKLGLAGLEIDLLLPRHISARRTVRAAVRVKNLKSWMPSFSIRVAGLAGSGVETTLYFPVLPAGCVIEEPVDLCFPTRGRRRERTFQLTTRFPFGFAERRESVTLRHEIIVYPCLDPRPFFESLLNSAAGEIEARQRGRGHDFYRIRPYEATESARHVDWKATAHTGSLQVREFSRDDDQTAVIYLDLDVSPEHVQWFETAVECAAFLSYRLGLLGCSVRLRTQDFDFTSPAQGEVYEILRYLALVAPRAGAAPSEPDSFAPFQIVLSPDPARMEALGWGVSGGRRSCVLGLSAFDNARGTRTPA
jgi:uncharacterized protein (DUF58 family)